MSTQGPVEEKLARASVLVVAATASAAVRLRGRRSHESPPVFPAEVARNTLRFIMFVSAFASVVLKLAFHEVLATAGAMALLATQLTASTAPEVVPLPAQLSHFTPCSRTPLATPYT